MDMLSVEIRVPANVAPFIATDDINLQFKQSALLLYPYIKNETISHGRAAELLGIPKLDLIDFYSSLGLPYFDLTADEIDDDVATIRALRGQV
ncbi:MAG: UPF0175 family protein [Turicibacter sp.]|nr:UPF0175 family protein [Turicibacter sp.]